MKVTVTEDELQIFAERLAAKLEANDVLILTGDLGAGKTSFTKGLGKGLGITQTIKSPTFTIVREYTNGRLPLYHMDVYRIGDDPDSFDMDSYLTAGGVTVIEWGEMLDKDLPEEYLAVEIDRLADDEARREIRLIAHGKRYEALL